VLKYVNKAVIFRMIHEVMVDSVHIGDVLGSKRGAGDDLDPAPMYDIIELFFFAYRDFVGDADRLLENYRFGRAHHRVLHFVNRQPGLKIADILSILQITKQSLGRVLKDLLETGYIEVQPGLVDRRQRLLFATVKGRKLALDLAKLQSTRFARVFEALPPGSYDQAVQFLLEMIDPRDRGAIAERLRLSSLAPKRQRA
jgi:DNA-binding MarR family transcriptional regulator